jgi:hypothetical protein
LQFRDIAIAAAVLLALAVLAGLVRDKHVALLAGGGVALLAAGLVSSALMFSSPMDHRSSILSPGSSEGFYSEAEPDRDFGSPPRGAWQTPQPAPSSPARNSPLGFPAEPDLPDPAAAAPSDDEISQAENYITEELRFNRPERMRINHSYVVEAQIGEAVVQSLGDIGPTIERDVPILANRLVRLVLISDDFDIEKLHQVDDLLIEPGTSGLWSWRVTPKHEGENRRMLLQVYGVQRDGAFSNPVLIKTYQEEIPVDVTAWDRAQLLGMGFLAQWEILAGIFGAIGGLWVFISNVLKFLRQRKQGAQPAA